MSNLWFVRCITGSQVVDCIKGDLTLAGIDAFILDCKDLLVNLVDVSVSLIDPRLACSSS
jgi:hypothetical protein